MGKKKCRHDIQTPLKPLTVQRNVVKVVFGGINLLGVLLGVVLLIEYFLLAELRVVVETHLGVQGVDCGEILIFFF